MKNPNADTHSNTLIPSWLETPPCSKVNSPVSTRLQELPFGELSWEDFERLCLRLARLEAEVEHCQLYGEHGQKQEGIDIYARKKSAEKYTVYQCKRVEKFGPAKIKKAVENFLAGEWSGKSETFVLCTNLSLVSNKLADALESQIDLMRDQGINLLPWDSDQLSIKLKDYPRIVDDFFGRQWVKEFCGEEEADRLGSRLDLKEVAEFRTKLGSFYQRVFNTHDPGLPIARLNELNSLKLEDRFVIPDVYEPRSITPSYTPETHEPGVANETRDDVSNEVIPKGNRRRLHRSQYSSYSEYQQRQVVTNWLTGGDRNIILGDPGSGKSTLLRFLAIDLLQRSPRLTVLAQKWGTFLPVWVPFALWTKFISDPPTSGYSLSQFLQNWLNRWDEQRLWPLVEKALKDERLLLLVDGLDEWTNESAAKIALDRLQVFVAQRNVPAIMTSRPHGFERLGMQETGWQRGYLSEFSLDQQKQLAQIWFTYKIRSLSPDSSKQDSDIERKAQAESENFLAELHRSPDLLALGKVPLLLSLLIYHTVHNFRLPLSRFKAFDSLIEHLISTHPQKRKTAAFLTEMSSDRLTDDEIKQILAHLAYYLQVHSAEGIINHEDAKDLIENYLKDDSDFGLEPREARRYSREVLEVGEDTIGLLVRYSPQEIGFFHRVFLEYLAAYHLSRQPLTRQLSIIETRCVDQQWHEIILGLFHFAPRAEDNQQFVNRIKAKRVNEIEQYAVELLLCEIAFGEFNCSATLAKNLAREAFERVELSSWMPHRERLLQYILEGLRSTKVKKLVKSKLQSWFPCRSDWREDIFSALGNWPKGPEVVECLWRGIHDEASNNQRAAAWALADVAKDDLQVRSRIAFLAKNAADPKVRAAAIGCLLRGWPDCGELEPILESSRHSMSPELRLVSIIGRIQKGTQTEQDWEELLRLSDWELRLDYHWQKDVPLALMEGWPQLDKTKRVCFEALRNQQDTHLARNIALHVLLAGYPQNEEVAQFCIEEIKHQKYPFSSLSRIEPWRLVNENFKNHAGIVAAIDEWIVEQEHRDVECALAALVGTTPTAKAKLLSSLNVSFPHWPARSLLEGWGMQDSEVAGRMIEIATGAVGLASRIGHLLPQIITDKTSCHKRLLEIVQSSECDRLDFVLDGFAALGNTNADTEVVDAVLKRLPEQGTRYFNAACGRLIEYYLSNPRVKNLAKQELLERGASYGSIARVYGDDEEIRQRIIELSCPLPAKLRHIIASYLSEGNVDEEFALSLLKLYDHETDDAVKTQASIGYHKRLKASARDIELALKTLSQNIVCYGHDYEKRRRAAFCGLVTLGRLDVMMNARERIGDDRACAISIIPEGVRDSNVPILQHLLQNWEAVKIALGDEFWERLSRYTSGPVDIWDALCMFADEYPSPRDEALRLLEDYRMSIEPNILHFLGRVRPRSQLLMEYCLKALGNQSHSYNHPVDVGEVAAELLSTHFAGNREVLRQIIPEGAKNSITHARILTLCEGWSEVEELEDVFETAISNVEDFLASVHEEKRPVSYGMYFQYMDTHFQLMCQSRSSQIVFDTMIKILPDSARIHIRNSRNIACAVTRRLRTDDHLFDMLMEHLKKNPTPSDKATIPRFISAARGISTELRTWCINEASRQHNEMQSPEIGLDLMAGYLRSVTHSLLDVVYGTTPSAIQKP